MGEKPEILATLDICLWEGGGFCSIDSNVQSLTNCYIKRAGDSVGKRIVIELENFDEAESRHIENAIGEIKVDSLLAEDILFFGDLQIDPLRRTVLKGTEPVSLTATEFDILFYLAKHPGFVFTRRQIYEAIWKSDFFQDEANVTSHIGHIRKKIEPNPNEPVYIQTVRGVGYKFVQGFSVKMN